MDTLFIAHRGQSFDAPENTLASIILAWKKDVRAVEIDIRMTSDGCIVVFHDEDLQSKTGVRGKLKNKTLNELKTLDAGLYRGEKWRGEKIPTLTEVLNTVPPGKKLFVEIKGKMGMLPELIRVISASELSCSQVIIIGFDFELLKEAKKRLPDYKVLWVCFFRDRFYKFWFKTLNDLIAKALKAGLDGLDVYASRRLDRSQIHQVKQAGLALLVWTVNDPKEAFRLVSAGIDGITSDRASWLEQNVKEIGEK